MGGANEILGPTTLQQTAPIDLVLDLVVDGLRADPALVALVGGVDRIAAYVPYPPPELHMPAGNACSLMVCPYASAEESAPGIIAGMIQIQVILRFALNLAEPKARGSASWAAVPWHVRRILSSPGMRTLVVSTPDLSQPVELAVKHSDPLPSPPATPMRQPNGGWVYDYSQPWKYEFNANADTGRPYNLVLAGG